MQVLCDISNVVIKKFSSSITTVVGNGATYDRYEPRTKIQENKMEKILNFGFCPRFKSVSG